MGRKRIVAIIQARMTSTRLPGKMMMSLGGFPMLQYLVRRLKSVKCLDDVVLATTTNLSDDVLIDVMEDEKLGYFRGSETDVTGRVLEAAKQFSADVIVEITGDNPLMDAGVIEQTVNSFLTNRCDYAANDLVKSFPIGMNTRVFSRKALEKSWINGQKPEDKEHISWYITHHPEEFKLFNVYAHPDHFWPELSLTVDEKKDFEFVELIVRNFPKKPLSISISDIFQFLKEEKKYRVK